MNLQRVLPPIGRHKLLYPLLALERLVVLSTAIIFYQFNWLKTETILPAYIAGSLFSMSFAIWLIRREVGRPIRPDAATCRQIIRYSWPLIPTIMIGLLSTNTVDYLMIRRFMGNAELAVYALAIQIAGIVQQVPQIAGLLSAPRIIKMRLNNNIKGINHLIRNQIVPCLWLWCMASFTGAVIISWVGNWFPAKYILIVELSWPLAVVTAVIPLWYILWSPILTAYEQVRTLMWSSMITGSVNIIANFLLIPRYGVVGSAWASLLAYSLTILFVNFLIRKNHELKSIRTSISNIPLLSIGISFLVFGMIFQFSRNSLTCICLVLWIMIAGKFARLLIVKNPSKYKFESGIVK
jgi:O-antigen/teichoic acid export membrane protein